MKSLAKSILTEMALDLGDAPDWIDPRKKQQLQQGTHPYADNPAFPRQKPPRRAGAPHKDDLNRPDPTQSYSELIASHVYPDIIRKVHQYTGTHPRQSNPNQLMMQMMQAMQQAVRLERNHREELQQAAIEVVLSLPEFKDAKEAIDAGDLHIEATLLDPNAMTAKMKERIKGAAPEGEDEEDERPQMKVEPDEEDAEERAELGLDVPEIAVEYNEEAKKRRFINMLIQGAAINKNYAYHQISDQLRAIDPNILTTYGKLMSIAELMYWIVPEEALNAAMGSGQGGGGMEEVTPEDDGTWTIRASALCFPVLIQELAKGLYEFLSHDEDELPEVRGYTSGKSDTLANEQWDIMQGPGVWRHLNHIVNQANASEFMSRIFRHIVKLPTGEFNRLMQEILKETPEGKRFIQQLAADIRAEDEGRRQESMSYRFLRQIKG